MIRLSSAAIAVRRPSICWINKPQRRQQDRRDRRTSCTSDRAQWCAVPQASMPAGRAAAG